MSLSLRFAYLISLYVWCVLLYVTSYFIWYLLIVDLLFTPYSISSVIVYAVPHKRCLSSSFWHWYGWPFLRWGPFCIATSICVSIQSCLKSRGHSSAACWSSASAAGWRRALLRRVIRLLVLCDLLCVGVSGGKGWFGGVLCACLCVTVGSWGGW